MKQKIGNFQVCALGIILNRQGLVLMGKRAPNVKNAAGRWEPISGRLAPGEHPMDGLKREIKEELGRAVRIKIVEPYYTFRLVRDDGYEVIGISFFCKYLGGKIHLNEEHTDYRWVTIDEAIKLTKTPGVKKELRYLKSKYLTPRS